jgi:type I restriction enzyme S subunit
MYGANVGQLGRLKCPATVNQAVCGLVVNKEIASSRFVFYALLETREALAAKAQGAAQQNLNQGLIREFRIPSPQLPTQRKIAAILSAYDDLIENNLRRIKILEEMAQNLYREWFVKFRFPGHQHARFTDSSLGRIPEGWEVRELQEIAQVIDCLHSKKPQQIESGTRILLQLYNIGDGGKIDLSDIFLIADDDYQKWISRIEVRAGDCVITNVGRVGAVAQIPIGLKAALGRNMTAVRPVAIGPTYLIEYLLSPHMIKEVQIKKDAGSIMDSLNVKGIVKLVVPVGPRPLMDCFEETTRPMRALIERLFEKNNNLRRTRDLLLPRLISGKVDVSELEIAISEETKT